MPKIPWWVWALAGTVLVAGLLSRYASQSPDGLESVIEGREIPVAEVERSSPLPDYATPGVEREGLSIFVAAAVGVIVVFLVTFGAGKLLSRRQAGANSNGAGGQA